jgi:hypothetical protein
MLARAEGHIRCRLRIYTKAIRAIAPTDLRRYGVANCRFPVDASPIQEQSMAKGQKRSNREIKKPKKAKLKSPATGPASSSANVKPGPLGRGKKT